MIGELKIQQIPGVSSSPFWCRKWFIEIISGLPPAGLAGIAAYRAYQDKLDRTIVGIAVAIVIWLLLALLVKALVARRDDEVRGPETDHDGIMGAITAVHAVANYICSERLNGQDPDIRTTFHRVVPPVDAATELEQILPYLGGDHGGLGRKFSIHTGITGQSVRCADPFTLSSHASTEAEHREELVREWGYSAATAKKVTPGRYSAMAIPVLDQSGRHALGVVYLDSSHRDLFTDPKVTQALIVVCDAVGDYITRRY